MESNLCLGTAQLGNIYGITNKKGKISDNHINKILDSAIKKEITFFDTAHAYGDAEKKIGKYLKNKNINVISKFSTGVKKIFKDNDINVLEDNFQQSLKRLNRKYINSYLLHNHNDFKKDNKDLFINWLKGLRDRGLVNRLGVSIYEEKDLEYIPLDEIQVIQLPISIYDQRLMKDSILKKLQDNNISIHVRSIFLQGLLLEESSKWPNFLNKSFINHHINYQKEVTRNNLTLLESATSFIKKLDFAELTLFGVTSISELNCFYKCWNSKKISNVNLDFSLYKWDNIKDIDPRKWY